MKLQTTVKLQPQRYGLIDHHSEILLLGSCFSENIGSKLVTGKFPATVNPFGILFHPLAIEKLITRSINQDYYSEHEIYFHNEQWCCLDAHSRFNTGLKADLLLALNDQIDITHEKIQKISHLIITLGTAWTYRHITSDQVVANCHKIPQKQFIKELLSVNQIAESLDATTNLIRQVNPDIQILFTVSPIRHLKDGFVENTLSKSHLISGVHLLLNEKLSSSHGVHYFPSYEIMMDELRDYRFYKADLVHPTDVAIDYIWEKFKSVWISKEAQRILKDISAIALKLEHKPFQPHSEAHQQFNKQLEEELNDFRNRYPHISI